MAQVIQIKRKTNGAGSPSSLAPGEPAYNTTGNTLLVGDASGVPQLLVGAARQVELAGNQTITGPKTIAVNLLKIIGGGANEVLKTDGAGNLSFTPAAVSQIFVGTFNATASTISWTAGTGSGNTLPAPASSNNGWYLICTTAGSAPPTGSPAGPYAVSDWLISNGSVWTHVALGGTTSIAASQVGVSPTVSAGDDVQEVLTTHAALIATVQTVNTNQDAVIAGKTTTAYVDAAVAPKVTGPASSASDDIVVFDGLTGKLVKSAGTSVAALVSSINAKASRAGDTISGTFTFTTGNVNFLSDNSGITWGANHSIRMQTNNMVVRVDGQDRITVNSGGTLHSGEITVGMSANARGIYGLGYINLRQDSGGISNWFGANNATVTGINQGGYICRAQINGYNAVDLIAMSTAAFDGSGNRSAKFRINTLIAEASTMQIDIGNGVVVGGAAGGFKGTGTINAEAVYDDNVILSCYVLEALRTGEVDLDRWDAIAPGGVHQRAREFVARLDQVWDVRSYAKAWRDTGVLPGFPAPGTKPGQTPPMGELVSALIEQVELHAGHAEQLSIENKLLHGRVEALEAALDALAARVSALGT